MADAVKYLKANLHTLTQRDRNFAMSLLSAFDKGIATASQRDWIATLARRIRDNAPQTYPRIRAMMMHAHSAGVEKVKIRLRDVTLSYSALRDTVYVNDPVRTYVSKKDGTERKVLYGTLDGAATFRASPFVDQALIPGIKDTLKHLDDDPHKAARLEGHATGRCCFCARRLDNPESVAVGYGPICAEKYGLAHGGTGVTDKDNVFERVTGA